MATSSRYVLPYFDSAVFISWLKDADEGPLGDGTRGDRRPISESVLRAAEGGVFKATTSFYTFAEVYKKRGDGNQRLTDEQNGRIVKYFENEWISWVPLERLVAERANALLVEHRAEKLRPGDAIHLASALVAKCDVLLTWDGPLMAVQRTDIRIEFPRMFEPPPPRLVQATIFDDVDAPPIG